MLSKQDMITSFINFMVSQIQTNLYLYVGHLPVWVAKLASHSVIDVATYVIVMEIIKC
jgi:hypothetical protein